jgi:hypothetical protein
MTNLPGSIADLLAQAAELSRQGADLALHGDVQGALRLEEAADRLRRRARSEARRSSAGPAGSRGPAASTREVAISALNELGVASAPRSVADYALARFAVEIDSRSFGALRRDEQRSWLSPRTARPLYVVPALEGHRFLALRAKVGLSSWPLEARLIGPWSERVDHLRATVNIARQARWLSESSPSQAGSLLSLLGRYAMTLAAATAADPASVEEAASVELAALEEPDRTWRADAAARARAILDERAQMWGAAPPRVVGGMTG